jgi:hypothetical protein
MRSIFTGLLAAVALVALASAPARAQSVPDPITVGSGWQTFLFGDTVFFPDFQDADGNTLDITFTLTAPTVLRVTDGFFDGDQFDVDIFNDTTHKFTLGATSTPVSDGAFIGDNWSGAFFTDPRFSHRAFLLGPGTYDVTGFVIQSPFGAGQGALELGAVPEPATWAVMLTGFAGLGLALRRSRRKLALTA